MARQQLKIIMAAAEAAPLAKEGGLADVVGALPRALIKLQAEVKIFLPYYGFLYRKIKASTIKRRIGLKIDRGQVAFELCRTKLPGSRITVYLIKHQLFNSKGIYLSPNLKLNGMFSHQLVDTEKFVFFAKAVLAACQAINYRPDIIHCHDWHTAIIPTLLNSQAKDRSLPPAVRNFFSQTKTLYTIHNLAHQGIAKPTIVGFSKLKPDLPLIKADLKNGDINLMVQGILGADAVNTVSPTYAKEILHHYQGAGLEKILRRKKKNLSGILNGIDTKFFNPAADRYIKQKYNVKTLAKKSINKLELQQKLGLAQDKKIALVGLVSRLVWQKGIELLAQVLEPGGLDCQFVCLGTGQPEYENQLKRLAKKYPQQISANIMFDAELAQLIYAGADIFLMPSRFEPCGLGQLIAMRYGAVPLVRLTGGLADTVKPPLGFGFKKYSAAALRKTWAKALKVYYRQPDRWRRLQQNGMKQDFSWVKSAKEYLKLYQKLIKR